MLGSIAQGGVVCQRFAEILEFLMGIVVFELSGVGLCRRQVDLELNP